MSLKARIPTPSRILRAAFSFVPVSRMTIGTLTLNCRVALCDRGGQMAMGGSDDADVHGDLFAAGDAANFVVFDGGQHFGLKREREAR
jgi:hypothetical protein